MTLRILHVLFGYYPDPIGGTEVYVEALARYQHESGLSVGIAAPADSDANYQHAGLEVFRYALDPVSDLEDLYGEGDVRGALALEAIATSFRADVVHFHAFTRGVSLLAAKKIRASGAALVVTYHTPTVTCARGSMMRWGETPCSGNVKVEPCAACAIHGKGLSRTVAKSLSILPSGFNAIANFLPASSATTALRLPTMMKLRQQACLEFLQLADHWVGVCDWVCEVLRSNGVPQSKLTLSRQGVARRLGVPIQRSNRDVATTRMVMLGRMDITKGWHLILQAMQRVPNLDITVDAYAVRQGSASVYENELIEMAKHEPRFFWRDPVPGEQILHVLNSYDVLLAPSQLLETGPLVVLEAFEAGIPVIGSALGGNAELVQHEINGFLVEAYDDANAWVAALKAIVNDANKLRDWTNNIQRPRGMLESCKDMVVIYQSAIEHRSRN